MTGPTAVETETARRLRTQLDVLASAERRNPGIALVRVTWSAALEETRILLVHLHFEVDNGIVRDPA